jgi:hypothetical protein
MSLKAVRLYLLGSNELFGLEEVIEGEKRRKTSVICTNNNSIVYFIKRDDFMNSVNLFKFSDKIQQEKFLKESLYSQRISETEMFRL